MNRDRSIIVGIDFGTTYTAAAWADTLNPSHIEVIKNWPTAGAIVSSQVPTEIAYEPNDRERFSWGYNIKPQSEKIKWFKLGLEIEQDKLVLPLNPTPVEIVCDFLAGIYKHVMFTLDRRVGGGGTLGQPAVVSFALTVPAIWSDTARKKLQEAAIRAGLGRTSPPKIFSEPECAAIHALRDLDDVNRLRDKDRILVCDAGGGTVDIITYDVIQTTPLKITECTAGNGDYCGSTFIDREFERLLLNRIGTYYNNIAPLHMQQAIKNFEAAKAAFRDDPEQEAFYVNVPTLGDIEDAGIRSGNLLITRTELRSLFDPAVSRILDLIKAQTKELPSIDLILLVGGFGESEYLYQRILGWARKCQRKVLQPREASTAIVRGAVLKGLEATGYCKSQITRRARKWYGVTINELYIEGRHLAEDQHLYLDTGQVHAKNHIRWLIKKHSFHRDFRHLGPWTDNLVSCASEVPPSRLEAPAVKLCTITSDLSHLKKKSFDRHWRKFQPYYTARYTLCLGLQDDNLTFRLEYEGQQYGVAYVDFD
ncbi:MAG: hypothetical protein Q9184_004318 [Pyrenodesmia sp. 2 TL-2023]